MWLKLLLCYEKSLYMCKLLLLRNLGSLISAIRHQSCWLSELLLCMQRSVSSGICFCFVLFCFSHHVAFLTHRNSALCFLYTFAVRWPPDKKGFKDFSDMFVQPHTTALTVSDVYWLLHSQFQSGFFKNLKWLKGRWHFTATIKHLQ